jgi:hypothetical protein
MYHAIIFNCHDHIDLRPLGPHRIASFLRAEGWDVEVIDFFSNWTNDQLKELIRQRTSDNTVFFGFSMFMKAIVTTIDDNFLNFIKWVKETYPDVATIMGSMVRPRKADRAAYDYIDYYINGYGEIAILDVVKHLIGNTTEEILLSPEYDHKVILANVIKPYNAFPMKSLMVKYEDRDYLMPHEWLGMEFSRGCRFKCAFCNFPVLGVKSDYTRDAEDWYTQMMDTYDRFGVHAYTVADETFNDSTFKLDKFGEYAKKIPFEFFLTGFIRADLLVTRPQDWEKLLQLNFLGHFYGVETFNRKSGQAIGKGMDPDRLKSTLVDVKNYFKTHGTRRYRGSLGLIAGLPHETPESMEDTYQWIIDNWQGENYHITALDIPVNEKEDPLSTIAMNYKDYGYEVDDSMTIQDMVDSGKLMIPNFIKKGVDLYMNSSGYWKNDIWDKGQAYQSIVNFIARSNGMDFKLNNFVLRHAAFQGNYGLDHRVDHMHNTMQIRTMHHNNNVMRYIDKKLGS